VVVEMDDREVGRKDWAGWIRDVVGLFVAASGSFGGLRREAVGGVGLSAGVLTDLHGVS
jgi:hypothetical protein